MKNNNGRIRSKFSKNYPSLNKKEKLGMLQNFSIKIKYMLHFHGVFSGKKGKVYASHVVRGGILYLQCLMK